jgi:hypothetical protein
MTALALVLALATGQEAKPTVPAGSSEAFQTSVRNVVADLAAGSWALAAQGAARLPDTDVTVSLDGKLLDTEQSAEFKAAVQEAMDVWAEAMSELKVSWAAVGETADVRFNFVPSLPEGEGGRMQGAVHFFGGGPAEPRVEAVIALVRDTPSVRVEAADVRAEAAYAIGASLGLAGSPRPGSSMGRTDAPMRLKPVVMPDERRLARRVLELSGLLRKAAAEKRTVELGRPVAVLQPAELRLEGVRQGEPLQTSFEVSNQGDGELEYRVVPDCGCFTVGYTGTIAPGATSLVQVLADTSEFPGPFRKALYLYTNDPDTPVRRIPVESHVRPAYRFLGPATLAPVVLGESGGTVELFLAIDPDRPFKVTAVEVSGATGQAVFEPWSGQMADPELGEAATDRQGYRIRVLLAPGVGPGRVTAGVFARTDDPKTPRLQKTFQVQQGIVAMPASIYFGEFRGAGTAHVIVSRPGRPFQVLGLETDTDFVAPSLAPYRGSDYKLTVRIAKDAPKGRFSATVTIKTDDPGQPTVTVPVSGVVR